MGQAGGVREKTSLASESRKSIEEWSKDAIIEVFKYLYKFSYTTLVLLYGYDVLNLYCWHGGPTGKNLDTPPRTKAVRSAQEGAEGVRWERSRRGVREVRLKEVEPPRPIPHVKRWATHKM